MIEFDLRWLRRYTWTPSEIFTNQILQFRMVYERDEQGNVVTATEWRDVPEVDETSVDEK